MDIVLVVHHHPVLVVRLKVVLAVKETMAMDFLAVAVDLVQTAAMAIHQVDQIHHQHWVNSTHQMEAINTRK